MTLTSAISEMTRAPTIQNWAHDDDHAPFRGGLSLGWDLLYTKFEVSNSIFYKDMKGSTKCKKWDGLG